MRWEELSNVLPYGELVNISNKYSSVEALIVNCSKALWTTAAYGSFKDAARGDMYAGQDVGADTLATVEAVLDRSLAPKWRSGAQLMQELRHIVQVLPTGCTAIDKLLGGGLREGTLVEVAGETASGKTQLCLSAAATTANRGEEVLFVDTTGSFAPQRVVEMAQAEAASSAGAWSQVRRIFQELTRRLGYRHELCHLRSQAVDPELTSRVLGCISVLRPYNVHDLLSLLDRLEVDLQQPQEQELALRGPQLVDGGKVPGGALRPRRAGPRLIIVDSVSALLSTVLGSNQHKQGTTLLTAVGRTLKQIAERHCTAVLVTNHVTSAASVSRGGMGTVERGSGCGRDPAVGVAGLKPALGEQWRSQPHIRVQLSIDDTYPPHSGIRIATLTASPMQACGQKLGFRVVASGLQGT